MDIHTPRVGRLQLRYRFSDGHVCEIRVYLSPNCSDFHLLFRTCCYTVSRMGSERLPAKVLHCYINGKRNQGRQVKKWVDNVKEDMEAKKLNDNNNKQWFWCGTETNIKWQPRHHWNDGREQKKRRSALNIEREWFGSSSNKQTRNR